MLANFTLTQCVPLCLQDSTQVMMVVQVRKDSVGTNQEVSKICSCRIFNECERNARFESFYTTGIQIKIDCFYTDEFCGHCNIAFEAMGCFSHYGPCQEGRPFLNEEEIQLGTKEKEMDEMRKQYIEEVGYTVVEMWVCECWKLQD